MTTTIAPHTTTESDKPNPTAPRLSSSLQSQPISSSSIDDENHIIELLEGTCKSINTLHDNWISNLAQFLHKCFSLDTRKTIRLKAIATMSQVFNTYCVIYEDELMDKIFTKNFANSEQEADLEVRKPIVHLLFDLASNCSSTKNCLDVLAVFRKILTKPLKMTQNGSDTTSSNNENSTTKNELVYTFGNTDVINSRLAINLLNKLFRSKLYSLPVEPAVTILDVVVSYVNLIYRCPLKAPIPAELPMILQELFSLFLNLRCNEHGYIGVKQSNSTDCSKIRYSPFVVCMKRSLSLGQTNTNSTNSSPLSSPTDSPTHQQITNFSNNYTISEKSVTLSNATSPNDHPETVCINLDGMFTGIISCIENGNEIHYDVLIQVLEKLPDLLSNKSFVSTATNEIINQLCISLSDLTRSVERRFTRTNMKCEIVHHSLKSLTSLLVYKNILEQRSVKFLLAAFGDSLKISQHVVSLFSTSLVELQDVQEMTRFLPQVLSKLSKFSATIQLATCMLEFLSYLILFPKLYENFSTDEYLCIFAIALPYTNPFKFNDYVTCLAFRVIAMWYLKCRPARRGTFVNYIKKSLQSNVIQPFKENPKVLYSPTSTHPSQTLPITHSCPPATTYDQRKRSCSLNTENSLKRFEHRQGSVTSIMLHLSKAPSSPPPNSPSSPITSNTFSFNNNPGCGNNISSNNTATVFGFPNNQLSLQLNEELIETFSDLLSRYTHGPYSMTCIDRNSCVDFLIDKGSSQTWLHGNSLVTITMSVSHLGWAEILIRRPTGNISWIGRLQNSPYGMNLANNGSDCENTNLKNDVIGLFSTMVLRNDILTSNEPDSGYNSATTPISNNSLSDSLPTISSSASTVGTAASIVSSSQFSSNIYNHYDCSSKLRDPICLPKDSKSELAVKNFDRITPYETHKIGIIYVDRGQVDNKIKILGNKFGSTRYMEFLKRLGIFIKLSDIDTKVHFIGGLDTNGEDGKFTYYWQDNITQVIFHVATLMPNREDDPQRNNKHRHIGNDHVCIVYNDSKDRFQLSTIKGDGQCIMACIVITPLEVDTNCVTVDMCTELSQIFSATEPKILSNNALSLYVRLLSIHINLASMIYERWQRSSLTSCVADQGNGCMKSQYVSNWVERLRCIKRIRKRLEEGQLGGSGGGTNISGAGAAGCPGFAHQVCR